MKKIERVYPRELRFMNYNVIYNADLHQKMMKGELVYYLNPQSGDYKNPGADQTRKIIEQTLQEKIHKGFGDELYHMYLYIGSQCIRAKFENLGDRVIFLNEDPRERQAIKNYLCIHFNGVEIVGDNSLVQLIPLPKPHYILEYSEKFHCFDYNDSGIPCLNQDWVALHRNLPVKQCEAFALQMERKYGRGLTTRTRIVKEFIKFKNN